MLKVGDKLYKYLYGNLYEMTYVYSDEVAHKVRTSNGDYVWHTKGYLKESILEALQEELESSQISLNNAYQNLEDAKEHVKELEERVNRLTEEIVDQDILASLE